jgi:hypothetical protein
MPANLLANASSVQYSNFMVLPKHRSVISRNLSPIDCELISPFLHVDDSKVPKSQAHIRVLNSNIVAFSAPAACSVRDSTVSHFRACLRDVTSQVGQESHGRWLPAAASSTHKLESPLPQGALARFLKVNANSGPVCVTALSADFRHWTASLPCQVSFPVPWQDGCDVVPI